MLFAKLPQKILWKLCKKICAHPYIAEHLNKALPGIVLQTSESSTKPSKHPTRHHPPTILHRVQRAHSSSIPVFGQPQSTRKKSLTADCAYVFPVSFSLRLQLPFLNPGSRFSLARLRTEKTPRLGMSTRVSKVCLTLASQIESCGALNVLLPSCYFVAALSWTRPFRKLEAKRPQEGGIRMERRESPTKEDTRT